MKASHRITRVEFEQLPNYSCSMPTAFRVGQMWRRAKHYNDQDLSDPNKWIILVDMIIDGTPLARWHRVHIVDDSEEIIRKRLYAK